jgi:glycosyltransferase involved in cell wall biosynthesis
MKKKVIIFIPSIEDGGVEKNLFIISNYFNENGISVELLTSNYDKFYKFDKGIKYIGTRSSFWLNKNRIIKYLVCLLTLFINLIKRKDKPLIFAFQANIYAVLVSKVLNAKIITRSNSAPAGWSKNIVKNILYKHLINLADDVMVNSLEFQKSFNKRFNIKAKCIYNPFDKNLIRNSIKKKKKITFFKKDYLNLISVGRLTNQKDHLTLLKSINLLEKNFKIRLLIIGKGNNETLLRNYIVNNKLQNKVKLFGYLNNPYPYIKAADAVILTSVFEGLPNILLEAQYLKKYIISTNCETGPKEILLNGKAGDLIKVGDYKKLSFLIKNYQNRKKIIKKKIFEGNKNFARFDYKLNCQNYLNFIIKNQ